MKNSNGLCYCKLLDLPSLDDKYKPLYNDDYYITVDTDTINQKKNLYDNKDIREHIETLRHQQSQVKREMNDNNKDAIIASLKRKIRRLEEENKELKEQLKVDYAEIYKRL